MHARKFIVMAMVVISGLTCAAQARANGTARVTVEPIVREVIKFENGEKQEPVNRRFEAVTLENRYLRVLVAPGMGERIIGVVDKTTGRSLFPEKPIPYSGNMLHVVGPNPGGIHLNHPYYHGGSGFTNSLPYSTETRPDGTAAVTMAFTMYPHLQRTVMTISLAPHEAGFAIRYRFENLAPYAMGFNPWINAAFPSRKDVQFILPTHHVAEHWFGINAAEAESGRYFHLEPWPINSEGVDRSYLRNADPTTSVFSYGLTGGYTGIYYHQDDAGMARTFDPDRMRAAKAFGSWKGEDGLPWCEIWGAISHNMEDPQWIGAHETRVVSDFWFPIHGIGGMTSADRATAINLGPKDGQLVVGVYPVRDFGRCAVRVVVDGVPLLQEAVELNPGSPFYRKLALPHEHSDEVRLTVLDDSGRRVAYRQVFLSPRPEPTFQMPEKPWHRRTPLTVARWQEAFTPLMDWGPWYKPVNTYRDLAQKRPEAVEVQLGLARSLVKDAGADLFRSGGGQPDEEKLKEARGVLEDLAKMDPPDARAVYWFGLVQVKLGEKRKAAGTLKELLGTSGETAAVRLQLGLLALGRDEPEAAVKHARAAVAVAPDSTIPRQLLALGLLRLDRPEEARNVLVRAREMNPVEVGTLELMRRAARAAGDAGAAKELAAELARLKRVAARQHEAGLAQVRLQEEGELPDHHAIKTITGPDMPGREPGANR